MAIRNRLGRRVGARFERFDPNAIDADGDGRVQDATAFERPALPRPAKKPRMSGSMASNETGMYSIEDLEKIAVQQGWTVGRTKKGHPIFTTPDGYNIPTSGTPSDIRSMKNFIAALRRNGLVVPRKVEKPKEQRAVLNLEAVKPTLRDEARTLALRIVSAKQKPKDKLSLEQLAESVGVEDEDLKLQLRDAVNDKFPGYFPVDDNPPTQPARPMTNRERRRRGLRGGIGAGQPSAREKHVTIVGEGLVKEAEAAGVSLDAILDDSDMETDVSWSSNSWSFGKTKKQEAGDAIIVRTNDKGEQEVLMIRRKTAPFTDGYTLPGGLLDEGETLEQTVDREMEEEVGISAAKADKKRYLGEIEARDWDPRFVEGVRVGGARYDVPADTEVVAASDARAAEWVPVKDLAAGKYRIGFGHAGWLALAFEDNPELSRKFDILARASRHRNQKIIKEVNKKRKEAGEKLFTRLGSPNKHYIPEGVGPLGMRKVDNLSADLAKVVTRNPGFFDKKTEEIFIYRAANSSAATARQFNMTEREIDELLLRETKRLEQKIRDDIDKKIQESGRKKRDAGLSGSIRADGKKVPALGQNLVERATGELELNDKQIEIVKKQTDAILNIFRTGEIYERPIHDELDNQRKEFLDSIQLTTATDGIPMLIAKPNPLLTAVLPVERDWASVELPDRNISLSVWEKIKEYPRKTSYDEPADYDPQKTWEEDEVEEFDLSSEDADAINNLFLDAEEKFNKYLFSELEKIRRRGGQTARLEVPDEEKDFDKDLMTSFIFSYYEHLAEPGESQDVLNDYRRFAGAVHDIFGHYAIGRAFDRHGEWANFLAMKDLIQKSTVLNNKEKEALLRQFFMEYMFPEYEFVYFGDLSYSDFVIKESSPIRKILYSNFDFSFSDLIDTMDTGRNGLEKNQNRKLSGAISRGKKIIEAPQKQLEKVVIEDARNKLRKARSISGAIRSDRKTVSALPASDVIQRAADSFEFNENQKQALETQLSQLHDAFKTGEVYNMPIDEEIDDMRKELLDSIRITTAAGGLPMIIAAPHPLIVKHFPRQRDWAAIELPEIESVLKAVDIILDDFPGLENSKWDHTRDGNRELSVSARDFVGPDAYQKHLHDIVDKLRNREGIAPKQLLLSEDYSGYTSWIVEYYGSLVDPPRASAYLVGSDGLHDLFGHYGIGRAYDRHGEWANYLAHKDMIEYTDLGLTPEQLEEAHRFWWREYGWLQLDKSPAIQKAIMSRVGENASIQDILRWAVAGSPRPISEILDILDSGRNGLVGIDGKPITTKNSRGLISVDGRRLSGSISRGKKLSSVNAERLISVSIADATSRVKNKRSRSSTLMGAMGIYDSDEELGQYIQELRQMMGNEWDGPNGDKVRRAADKLFNIDISQQERERLIDDLLDIEVAYSSFLDDAVDTFDYAAEERESRDQEWEDWLEKLRTTDPEEYEFWRDYKPSGYDGGGASSKPASNDVELPWERPIPSGTKTPDKKSKRKFFGWRKKKERPRTYINKTKFYGHDHLKGKQTEQLQMFRDWKNRKDWKGLHNAHYDWWAFPIDRGSAAYGDGYNVAGNNIQALLKDDTYMNNLREMAAIYAEAMGWDLDKGDWIDDLDWDKGQDPYTQAYGARLYKIARSLQIFGLMDEFDSFYAMVQSLRSDENLRRRIGKSQYWENPNIPFNKITPGTRRAERRRRNVSGSMGSTPNVGPTRRITGSASSKKPPRLPQGRNRTRPSLSSPAEKRTRFINEIDVDNWYIFMDDMLEYMQKVKSRDVKISTAEYQDLMKVVAILQSIDAIPTDDNGISIDASDDEIRRLRALLKTMTDLPNFFNLSEIYNALPTKQRPRTIDYGGPDV